MKPKSCFYQLRAWICLIAAIGLALPSSLNLPSPLWGEGWGEGVPHASPHSSATLRATQVTNDPNLETNPILSGLEQSLRPEEFSPTAGMEGGSEMTRRELLKGLLVIPAVAAIPGNLFAQQPAAGAATQTLLPYYQADQFFWLGFSYSPYAYGLQGNRLGSQDSSGLALRVSKTDPATGRLGTHGVLEMLSLEWYGGLQNWEFRSNIYPTYDRYGNPSAEVTFSGVVPVVENWEDWYKAEQWKPLPGVPADLARTELYWEMDRERRERAAADAFQWSGQLPIYKVLAKEKKDEFEDRPTRVRLAGFVQYRNGQPHQLLSVDRAVVAQLEEIWKITTYGNDRLQGLATPRSLTTKFFATPPTRSLVQELEQVIDRMRPEHTEVRLLLMHRLLQMQLLLGEESVRIDPAASRALAERLSQMPLDALEKLEENMENPETRRFLWDLLAHAHPWYALVQQAARRLGYENDPDLLSRVLEHWYYVVSGHRGQKQREAHGAVEYKMGETWRNVMVDLLNYNGLQTIEQITQFFSVSYAPEKGSVPSNWEERFPIRSFLNGRSAAVANDFDELMWKAYALRRAGYEVQIGFPVLENRVETIDVATKAVFPAAPILSVRDVRELDRWRVRELDRWRVMGEASVIQGLGELDSTGAVPISDEQMKALGTGRNAQYIFYEMPQACCSWEAQTYVRGHEQYLRDYHQQEGNDLGQALEDRGMGHLGMKVLELHRSLGARQYEPLWVGNLEQQILQTIEDRRSVPLAARFDAAMRERGIPVDEGTLGPEELTRRKMVAASELELLPGKFLDGVKSVDLGLQQEDLGDTGGFITLTVEGEERIWYIPYRVFPKAGDYIIEDKKIRTLGDPGTWTHEEGHHWDLDRTNRLANWYGGDLSDLFYAISWSPQEDGTWKRREEVTQAVIKTHFWDRTHALKNEREDIAVAVEDYRFRGPALREMVRESMQSGDFVEAAKYLFVKHLTYLDDADRLSFEYGFTPGDREELPLTFEEVLGVLQKTQAALQESEQEVDKRKIQEMTRLEKLILRYREIWEQSRETGRIVQTEQQLSEQAAAGMESVATGMAKFTAPVVMSGGVHSSFDAAVHPSTGSGRTVSQRARSDAKVELLEPKGEAFRERFPGVEIPAGVSQVYAVPADAGVTVRFYTQGTLLSPVERLVAKELEDLPDGLKVEVRKFPNEKELRSPGVILQDWLLELPYVQALLPVVKLVLSSEMPSLLSLTLTALKGPEGQVMAVIGDMMYRDAQGRDWHLYFV